MRLLVAYATRYGATEEMAERIGERLAEAGHEVDVESVTEVDDLAPYDAFVIGSAVYLEHWTKEAADFVRRHQADLTSGRPVWLFSSGPLRIEGAKETDEELLAASVPKEIPEFTESIGPRGHRVFFGALGGRLGMRHRLIRLLPAGRAMLPQGDFRAWPDIDEWANEIARELAERSPGQAGDGDRPA